MTVFNDSVMLFLQNIKITPGINDTKVKTKCEHLALLARDDNYQSNEVN